MRVLDLFAGCGGLSLGLSQAGFDIKSAIEIDKWAGETYAFNHPDVELYVKDINHFSDQEIIDKFTGAIDVIAGGPPCQGFSVSGKRQYGLHKKENKLLFDFLRYVEIIKPRLFIIENVRGLVSAKGIDRKKVIDQILGDLNGLGYHVYSEVLQAADYGLPQYRSRVFIVGSLCELSKPFPDKTHGPEMNRPPLSVVDAISDLPLIRAREGTDGPQEYTQNPRTDYQRLLRMGSDYVYNHEAMKHTKRLVERFSKIPPGGKGYDFGRGHKKHDFVTVYKSNNQRLLSEAPSLCITANFQSTYIHPYLNRNLTAREAARIMSYPDSYVFKGKRTQMSSSLLKKEGRESENFLSQYNQIGNSVPPLLACVIGKNLLNQIDCGGSLEVAC